MPMIPINIDEFLDGTIIEDNRIEFKSDWNPEKVLHTICAFANDYDNIGGGYIVVGVAEIDGRPIDYKGFDPKTLPAVERELSELCNLISPRYVPSISLEKYHGKDLLVIWVPGGEMRPYKCPVSLGKRKTDGGGGLTTSAISPILFVPTVMRRSHSSGELTGLLSTI